MDDARKRVTAPEYAAKLIGEFWPGDEPEATVTRNQLVILAKAAFNAGIDEGLKRVGHGIDECERAEVRAANEPNMPLVGAWRS